MSDSECASVLREALQAGDPEVVRALIESGADIRYRDENGYDALLDAVHGRDASRDPRLLDLLRLLIASGVNLNGVSSYKESGLRVLSRLGRFDAVRLLLDAGADREHLRWTPLMDAVALGSVSDVEAALAGGANLEEKDWWSRTAWLLALLAGDIAKAQMLIDHGADTHACGRCGHPPLFYPIDGHHPDVLRWLLKLGADVEQTDEFGRTALMEAVEYDDFECLEILLAAGADVDRDANGTALNRARSRDVCMRLLDAGSDPAELSSEGRRSILGFPIEADADLLTATPEEFARGWQQSFGRTNPERMINPFWESMIRSGVNAYAPRVKFGRDSDLEQRPIWCADRFGQSITLLPDGRVVQVAGEHEDWYDPDFCIYNDVFVHEPDGTIAIFGYPESVFPPTDFHTATLLGNCIYLIGSLGYEDTRRYGETPVYRLAIDTWRIEPVETKGEAPGWIYKHRAVATGPAQIRVWGGTIVTKSAGDEAHDANAGVFVLDVARGLWHKEPIAL